MSRELNTKKSNFSKKISSNISSKSIAHVDNNYENNNILNEPTIPIDDVVTKNELKKEDIEVSDCKTQNIGYKKLSKTDFQFISSLGKGSYGKVILAVYDNKKYALKIIDKKHMMMFEKAHEAHIEKIILSNLDHPYIIKLHSTFQDNKSLYFVLEYCKNKSLSNFLFTQTTLNDSLAQFYAAQIVSALEYLRSKGISHRDLKPDNIALDENMNIRLIDFATASKKGFIFDKEKRTFVPRQEYYLCQKEKKEKLKLYAEGNNLSYKNQEYSSSYNSLSKLYNNASINKNFSLVGTAEYVSPEALNKDMSTENFGVDLWALGCIIYKFFEGFTPFEEENENKIFQKIHSIEELKFSNNTPKEAQDLIRKLLAKDPCDRIGFNDIQDLKNHSFFNEIDFNNIFNIDPPNDPVILAMTNKKDKSLNRNISHANLSNINNKSLSSSFKDFNNSNDIDALKDAKTSCKELNINFNKSDNNRYFINVIKEINNSSNSNTYKEKYLNSPSLDKNIINTIEKNNKAESSEFLTSINNSNLAKKDSYCDYSKECLKFSISKYHKHSDNRKTKKLKFNDEAIILEAFCDKKSPWLHYNRRIIRLYNTPKLEYLDPVTNIIKGTIFLDDSIDVNETGEMYFDVITKSRKYTFRLTSKDHNAKIWVTTIKNATKAFKINNKK